jgi:hypothetical protein
MPVLVESRAGEWRASTRLASGGVSVRAIYITDKRYIRSGRRHRQHRPRKAGTRVALSRLPAGDVYVSARSAQRGTRSARRRWTMGR